jgi:hypothetical protein
VRLAKIGRSKLRNLLEQAAQFVGAQNKKKTAKKTSRRAGLMNPGDREPMTPPVPDAVSRASRRPPDSDRPWSAFAHEKSLTSLSPTDEQQLKAWVAAYGTPQ